MAICTSLFKIKKNLAFIAKKSANKYPYPCSLSQGDCDSDVDC